MAGRTAGAHPRQLDPRPPGIRLAPPPDVKPQYDPLDECCRVMMAIIIAFHMAIVGAVARSHFGPPPITATTNRAALDPAPTHLRVRA